ncbi:hypothetical protein HY029_05630 [Candidatus Gottesmanbacteria bacterium]|nr:hypothetical protein [Candidatus Gottesmanbacteria bacterium]
METFIFSFIRSFIIFGRNLAGIFNSPYVTYRKLSHEKTYLSQTVFIPLLIFLYFAFVSTLRSGIKNPFLLTIKFNTLIFFSILGFVMMLAVFVVGGKLLNIKTQIERLYLLWIYSLVPTLVWFFTTSILYLILPPPRTMTFLGKLYSTVFITFSVAVFLWKMILYYLTLRFSLKIDLWKISQISTLVIPCVIIYSFIMYKLGIFRIPFL